MEYDELYDESPYTSKEVPRRGGIMTTIRATFLICATILASVFAMLFYGYQQDQFVISNNGAFISIFDRKSRTINICDKGSCNLLRPHFETPAPLMAQGLGPQGQIIPHMAKGGHPMMGPHMGGHPMMGPQMGGGNPQMMGPPPPMGNPQMMGAQMGNRPMGPSPMMGPPPMMGNPQMISGPPPGGMQPQMMGGGAPAANQAPADEAAEDEEKSTADEPEEEAAPV